MDRTGGRGAPGARRGDRRGSRPGVVGGHRPGGGAGLRPVVRRPGAARADLPPAGGAAQVARAAAARAPPGALRAVRPHRRDPRGLQVRRRRRHRRAAQLRQPGQARAAERHHPRRGCRRAAGPGRVLRRPAHPHPAARGRGPDQRVQLPSLGPTGEVRPGVHRRGAEPGQAGHPDRVPDGPPGRADRRLRAAARRRDPAGLRQHRRPVRPPRRAGPGGVHRVGRHRPAPARPPGHRRAVDPVQRRSGLAELLDPRPRGRAGYGGIRPVRQAAGHRDDGQGRPEVHRDPACAGPGRAGGSGGGGGQGPAGRGGGGQPRRGRRPDGSAGRAGAARRGTPFGQGPAVGRPDRVRRPGSRQRGRGQRRARRVHGTAAASGRRRGPPRASRPYRPRRARRR